MKLTAEQREQIISSIEKLEYGSLTIQVNKENRHFDIIREERIRMKCEPIAVIPLAKEKKYT